MHPVEHLFALQRDDDIYEGPLHASIFKRNCSTRVWWTHNFKLNANLLDGTEKIEKLSERMRIYRWLCR